MDLEVMNKFKRFRLSEREGVEVELGLDNVLKSREVCEMSIEGKMYEENVVNFTGLKQTMGKLWCAEGSLKLIELKSKMFQFVFSHEGERRRVLEKRPWTFDKQLLVLQPWKKDIDRNERAFCISQIWIQAWFILIQWLSLEAT